MTRIIEPTGNGLSVRIRTAGYVTELALTPNKDAMYVRVDRIVAKGGGVYVRNGGPSGSVQDEAVGDITLGFVVVKSLSTLIGNGDIHSGWDSAQFTPSWHGHLLVPEGTNVVYPQDDFDYGDPAPDHVMNVEIQRTPSLWQRIKRWLTEQGDW